MAENDDAVRRTLALAAEQLDMDVAVLDEVTRDEEIVRFSAGDTRAMGIAEGAPAPRPLVRAQIRIVLSPRDARHFVLCCLSRQREAKLGKREVAFLDGIAESLRSQLQAQPALSWG
ncbi:MAG TPA: hypothetical protein VH256_01005 [Thermoleophilaceae bacterium]|jgi:hypothetical protein|nr:hypothetical protein [Thermoleophilaceae bacterium]